MRMMSGDGTVATALEAALALYDTGLMPLPLVPGEKATARRWQTFQAARPPRAEVEGWYVSEPRYGVALLMGPHLLAVDVDTYKNADPSPFIGTTPAMQR